MFLTQSACVLLALAAIADGVHDRRAGVVHQSHVVPALSYELPHQKVDNACPRFAFVPFALGGGAGHIFSDVVLGMELALLTQSAFVLDDLDDPSRPHGKYGRYPGLLKFLNVEGTETQLRQVRKQFRLRELAPDWDNATSVTGCNVVIKVVDTSCKTFTGHTHTATGFIEGCHTHLQGLYNKFKPVFMAKYAAVASQHRNTYGYMYDHDAVNIAWHIRIGDISLLKGNSAFFYNIATQLTTATNTLGLRARHYVFSSATGSRAPPGYEIMTEMGQVTFVNNLTVAETLHHFTLADIVVETGSSMTTIAHMLTSDPVFIYSCPKEGCANHFYDVDGLIRTDEHGTFLTTATELVSSLALRAVRRGLRST